MHVPRDRWRAAPLLVRRALETIAARVIRFCPNVIATQLFWALLWLPGFALVRRVWPKGLEPGLLGAIAYGYAASFALAAPAAVACYWLRLPVAVLSAWCALACAAALAWLTRERAWRDLGVLVRADLGLAALLLLLHLAMQARVGAWLDGDATFHLGRIRHLLDHGLDNRDIYLRDEYFTHIYHTNLVHALFAVATQVTHGDALDVWWASLAWAKLVIAAGHYALGFALFRRREPAWLLALVVSTVQAGMTYATYPNALAVGWLLPLILAVAVSCHDEASADHPAVIAIGCFVVGLVHPLYALFAMLLVGPYAAAQALATWRRGAHAETGATGKRARVLVLVAIALLAGAPSGVIARFAYRSHAAPTSAGPVSGALLPASDASAPARATPPTGTALQPGPAPRPSLAPTPALAAGGGPLEKKLERLDDGRWWFPPDKMGGLGFVLLGFGALLLGASVPSPTRLRARALLATAAPCALLIFWPPLCTLVAERLKLDAALPRLVAILGSVLFAALVGAVGMALDRLPRVVLAWPASTLVATALATRLLGFSPQSFDEHWQAVNASEEARHAMLDLHRARRAALRAHVPRGATVLASLREARYVVMLHDVFIVAADRGHGGVPDLRQRRRDVERMTNKRTPWAERSALLRRYGLRYVVFRDKWRDRYGWALEHGRALGTGGDFHAVDLGTGV